MIVPSTVFTGDTCTGISSCPLAIFEARFQHTDFLGSLGHVGDVCGVFVVCGWLRKEVFTSLSSGSQNQKVWCGGLCFDVLA